MDNIVKIRFADGFVLTIPDKICTVGHLMQAVEHRAGVPIAHQRLILGGTSLSDPAAELLEMGVRDGATVNCVIAPPRPSSGPQSALDKAVETVVNQSPAYEQVKAHGQDPSRDYLSGGGGGGGASSSTATQKTDEAPPAP